MKKLEQRVPNLRFKGFTDDWEQRKLGEISTSFSGGTPSVKNKSYYGGKIPFIRSAEIHKDKTELFITESGLKNSSAKLIKKGTLLYALYGATSGEVDVSNIDGAINQAIMAIFLQKDNVSFIKYYLEKNKDKIIAKYLQGGQGNLSASIIKSVHINLPFTEEQLKISNLIKKVESLIFLQQRKLDLLKQLKKGFLQKMFADKDSKQPVLRFKGFHDDWEQRKLGEISERILRKNSDLQSLLPLTISAQDGLVDQTIYFNKQVASKQLKNYLLLYNGDFAYNKSYSVGYPYGAIKRLDKYKQGVLSTLYIAFKPTNINSDFLQHYYDTDKWYREIYRNAAEGARNHGLLNISANDFFNSKLITPSDNDEQLKIAKIINVFNRLITLQKQKLAKYQSIKKSLLQQMFI